MLSTHQEMSITTVTYTSNAQNNWQLHCNYCIHASTEKNSPSYYNIRTLLWWEHHAHCLFNITCQVYANTMFFKEITSIEVPSTRVLFVMHR